MNKLINADLNHLVNWLNANKIYVNVKKTAIVIFKPKQKKFECRPVEIKKIKGGLGKGGGGS